MRKGSSKRRRFTLHSWAGFHFAAVMSLVLLTGTVAVLANEIDWLLTPAMRVTPEGDRVSWQEVYDNLAAHAPGHGIASIASMQGDHFAYRASMTDDRGVRYFAYINPWTGKVTGTGSPLTVQRFFRDLHRYLFMPAALGLPIVSLMAILLSISLYTGLRTTSKWRQIATRVRTKHGLRVAIGDAHKAAGLWSSWFIALIIVTGLWYFAELVALGSGGRFEPPRPALDETTLAARGDTIPVAPVDHFLASVKQAFPELRPDTIYFPFRIGGPVTILGRTDDPLVRSRANRVFLDPSDASIIKVQRSTEIGAAAYLNELADPLHFGYFAKLPSKLIWFVGGLAMTGLSLSGVWLTWRRVKTASPSYYQWATAPLLVLVSYLGVSYVSNYNRSPLIPAPQSVQAFRAGEIQGELATLQTADTLQVQVLLRAARALPNVRRLSVLSRGRTETSTTRHQRVGDGVGYWLSLPAATAFHRDELALALELADGSEVKVPVSAGISRHLAAMDR